MVYFLYQFYLFLFSYYLILNLYFFSSYLNQFYLVDISSIFIMNSNFIYIFIYYNFIIFNNPMYFNIELCILCLLATRLIKLLYICEIIEIVWFWVNLVSVKIKLNIELAEAKTPSLTGIIFAQIYQ